MSLSIPLARPASTLAATASLPMYDLPELRAATDAFWAAFVVALAEEGVKAPADLSRGGDLAAVWRDPALLVSQTCGYPLMTRLKGQVRLVATPRYRAPGCAGPFHRSAVIVASDAGHDRLADLRGARCAVNEAHSNTGMNLLRAEVARLAERRPFFSEVTLTGSHAASLAAVAQGQADVAAIDCVTLAHLSRLRPAVTEGVRVLAWTEATPALPFITSLSTPAAGAEALRRALQRVCVDRRLSEVRHALLLDGVNVLREAHYGAVLHLRDAAVQRAIPSWPEAD